MSSYALVGAGGLLAVLSATAAVAALGHFSRPADFDRRLAQVEQTVDRAQALAESRGDADAHAGHAVCPGRGAADLDAIRADLAAASAKAGLPTPIVGATAPAGHDDDRIAPVRVTLQVTGSYEALTNLLGQLDRSQPELFIDSLDLTSKTSAVDLRLSGKVFCWTVGR